MSSLDDDSYVEYNNNKKRKLITLGKCSKFNFYILGSAVFKLFFINFRS